MRTTLHNVAFATVSSSVFERAATATSAPAFASASAMDLPMPRPPPVTKARRPSRSIRCPTFIFPVQLPQRLSGISVLTPRFRLGFKTKRAASARSSQCPNRNAHLVVFRVDSAYMRLRRSFHFPWRVAFIGQRARQNMSDASAVTVVNFYKHAR